MQRVTETLWRDSDGGSLLRQGPHPDEILVIPHSVSRERAIELYEALGDYLWGDTMGPPNTTSRIQSLIFSREATESLVACLNASRHGEQKHWFADSDGTLDYHDELPLEQECEIPCI